MPSRNLGMSIFRGWCIAAFLVLGFAMACAGDATPPVSESSIPGPFDPSTTQFEFARGLLARSLHAEAEEEFSRFLTTYPNDPRVGEAWLWRGESHFAQEDYQNAALDLYAYLTKATNRPKERFARLRYGCCLFELKRYDEAAGLLQPLLGAQGADENLRASAAYYLGLARRAQNKLPEAGAALARVTAGPLAGDALYERAEIYSQQERHVEAANLFTQLIETYPEHRRVPRAYLRRGESLRMAGQLDQAAASFEALRQQAESGTEPAWRAAYGLAWIRFAQMRLAEARDLAKSVAEAAAPPLADDAAYLWGMALLQLEEYTGAEAAFQRVDTGDFVRAAALKRAWAFLLQGEKDLALATVQEAGKRFADLPADEVEYLLGRIHAARGDAALAIKYLLAVRERKSAYHVEAAMALANAYADLADWSGAAAAYAYVAETFPAHAWVVNARLQQGQARMQAKQYLQAIPAYAAVLANNAADKDARVLALAQQAACYYFLGQFANMQQAYRQLLEVDGESAVAPEAVYWLAWYEYDQKQFAAAADLYAEMAEAFPNHELVGKARYRHALCLYHDNRPGEAAEAFYEIVLHHPHTPLEQQELLWLGQYLMDASEFERADKVYEALLAPARKPDREARALAFYFQAESRRRRGDWPGALQRYDRLLGESETGLEDVGQFGRAMCLRRLGRLDEARVALGKVSLRPDDPLAAHYHAELGFLDFAQQRYAAAVPRLMRVGLLYDLDPVAGEALWTAGQACLALEDRVKARICFEELAGTKPHSFGQRYPASEWTRKGEAALAGLSAAPGEAP